MEKNQWKKMLAAVGLWVCILSGCAGRSVSRTDDSRLHIVCTTFPQYDWMRNLIRGNEENILLILLTDRGGDLHNFQPSALDIANVSDCDLFVYVGGESDVWVDDALSEAVNSDMRVINMMELISEKLVEEDHLEGFEYAGHEGHGHEEHETEYDEHIWLSLRNAGIIVKEICAELEELDSVNASLYEKNCNIYLEKLNALDVQYAKVVGESRGDTLLFADRFPFRYFVEDYGIKYYAAFEGCSAETEASFGTVAFLAGRLDDLGIGAVIVLDGSDDRLAQVLIENTEMKNQKIFVLNALQSVSRKDIKAGISYLSAMEENLNVLRQALNQTSGR
ncbi:MAG: metal ABC transporter substrate-binding protein [Lachnospiraceae bacterium]|nr:metal ABC transporter substrate-binding protein [Lachnospiraceae bacterium]